MRASNPGGPERPRIAPRSIRFTFTVMVLVPAVCLALLWGAVITAPFGKKLVGHGFSLHSHRLLAEQAGLIAAGIAVILVAVVVMSSFARRISRDVDALTAAALGLADEQSQQVGEQGSQGGEQAPQAGDSARGGMHAARPRTAEVARAAAAVASLQAAAAAAAASEASLRDGLRLVIVSMARRNQSLLQRQLRLIDSLEQKASDSAALADLFSLDHLTTRMRRHAESLTILSGAAPARSWREPIPIIDVVRGAMAEVEDYTRVSVVTHTGDAVTGSAAADMIHLLAELMENATMFSPSGTAVEVRAGRVANGYAIEIDDRGLGIEPDQLSELNGKLALPPDFDLASADRLGLFVAAKLAARYGVRVSLRTSPYGGTTAIVLMPNHIVVPASAIGADPRPDPRPLTARATWLNLRSGSALALVAQRPAPAPLQATPEPMTPEPVTLEPVTPQPVTPYPGGRRPGSFQPASLQPATFQPGSFQPREPGNPQRGDHLPDSPPPDSLWSPTSRGSDRQYASQQPGLLPPAAASPAAASPAAPPTTAPPTTATMPPAAPEPGSGRPGLPQRGARRPAASQPEPSPGGPARSGRPAGDTYRGLPRRVRQANLSPHLKDDPPGAAGAGLLAAPPEIRPPEQARDLAASLQSGWRRGREEDLPDPAATPLPPAPAAALGAATEPAAGAATGDGAAAEAAPQPSEEG
ncbi:MAG TPA: ATP-binding protein [Streptosporangiaceae bacterium]|jgi:signal transduction histidine kinase